MLKKIAAGYGRLFTSAGKIIGLLAVCAALGAAVVWPLWLFATRLPKIYTAVVLSITAVVLLYALLRRARKESVRTVLLHAARFIIITAGLVSAVWLVFSGKRPYAPAALAASFILYGICAFGLHDDAEKKD